MGVVVHLSAGHDGTLKYLAAFRDVNTLKIWGLSTSVLGDSSIQRCFSSTTHGSKKKLSLHDQEMVHHRSVFPSIQASPGGYVSIPVAAQASFNLFASSSNSP